MRAKKSIRPDRRPRQAGPPLTLRRRGGVAPAKKRSFPRRVLFVVGTRLAALPTNTFPGPDYR